MNRPGPKPSVPCGTATAYRRHLRYKEQPCVACRAAWAAQAKAKYDAKREEARQSPAEFAGVAESDPRVGEVGVGDGAGVGVEGCGVESGDS